MKLARLPWRMSVACLLLARLASGTQAAPAVMAYYVGWEQSQMPPSAVDFSAMTAMIHFAVIPQTDGTLDAADNELTPANISAAVSAAHAAGKKILFTVGGEDSQVQFESAMSSTHQAAFIGNLVSFMKSNGYDGIDIDMEPMSASDETQFVAFVKNLRAQLNAISPRPMLTATAAWTPATFAAAASQLDQINLMTYSLSGPWEGWFAWHNAPVTSTGYLFADGSPPPSADTMVQQFVAAGVPKSQLGIGFSMDPVIWTGVSAPAQSWPASTPPTTAESAYNAVADQYGIEEYNYSNPDYHWDSNAQAPYLSITTSTPNQFVSYDNEVSAQAKVKYITNNGLGSLVVWDIQDGHRADLPSGKQDQLLEAIKQAAFGSSASTAPPTVAITTPGLNSIAVSAFWQTGVPGERGNSETALVTWVSSQPATTRVLYGLSAAYGSATALNPALTTLHSAVLTGLSAGRIYHYQVQSQAVGGVLSVSSDTTLAAPPADVLLFDDFDRPDGLITNEYAFWNPTSTGIAVSPAWQMDSGSFFVSGGNGWTGPPDNVSPNAASSNGTDSAVFRVTTLAADLTNVAVQFGLLDRGLSATSTTPAAATDGCNVMLRYQSEYNLYYLAINRRDNTAVIKKKVAGGTSNGGTYYDLSPSVAYNVPYNLWQQVEATAVNNANGSVTLQLFSGGELLVSAVDNGRVGGPPIRTAGGVGIRGDNADLMVSSFTVTAIAGSPAERLAAPNPSGAPALEAKAPQKFLSPALADGINDAAVFGRGAKEVSIFDLRGKRVFHASGGSIVWNCRDGSGQIVASGIYIAQIQTLEGGLEYQKFAVVK